MKITELLVESQQIQEGPLLNKIGSAMGNVAGTAAKGLGAVAGGVAGMKAAAKKGFKAGKTQVAKAGDKPAVKATPAQAAPAQPAGDSATVQGVKSGLNKALGAQAFDVDPNVPSAQGQKPAQPAQQTSQSQQAAPTAQQAAQAQTVYMQVKANIEKLDKKGKQRILALLQKELGSSPTAQPAAAPAPVQQTAPRSVRTGNKKVQTTSAKPAAKPAAQKVTASKENLGNMVAEGFTLFRKH
jgi:hypothetical protein